MSQWLVGPSKKLLVQQPLPGTLGSRGRGEWQGKRQHPGSGGGVLHGAASGRWQPDDSGETPRFFQYRRLTSEAQRGRSVRGLLDEERKESQRLSGKTDGGEITSELLCSIFSTIFKGKKKPSMILLKMQNTIGFLYCICFFFFF